MEIMTNASEEAERTEQLYQEELGAQRVRLDRIFAKLMLVEWAFAIGLAIVASPWSWEGKHHVIHAHVYLAVLMGAGLTLLPMILVREMPGRMVTRSVIAVSQMLWSALLIHLTGG